MNCALFNYQQIVKQKYSLNPAQYYNVYLCHALASLGLSWIPYQTFENIVPPENYWLLGSIVHYQLVPGFPNFFGGRYKQGDILTHESGHHLGLRHIYQGGCLFTETYSDDILDTPRQNGNSYGKCKVVLDTCPKLPGKDDNSNYMSIFEDTCRNHFTPGQVAYIQNTIIQYKPTYLRQLTPGCVSAIDSTDASPDLAPCYGNVETDPTTKRQWCVTSKDDNNQWGWVCCPSSQNPSSCLSGTPSFQTKTLSLPKNSGRRRNRILRIEQDIKPIL